MKELRVCSSQHVWTWAGGSDYERHGRAVRRWLPLRGGPFYRDPSTEGDILVSLPKLSKAYRRACFCLRGIRARGLHGYQRRDKQVRFFAGENPAGILRQLRVNVDLRKRAIANANAFPCWCVRSSRAASADETLFSRGTLAVVTHRGHLRPLLPASSDDERAPGDGLHIAILESTELRSVASVRASNCGLEFHLHARDEVDRRRSKAESFRIMAVEEILDSCENLLVAHRAPFDPRRIRHGQVEAMVGVVIQDRRRRRDVVAVADERVGQRRRQPVLRTQQLGMRVFHQCLRRVLRNAQRLRAWNQIPRHRVCLVENRYTAAKRKPAYLLNRRHNLDSLSIHALGVAGKRPEGTGLRVEGAWHGDDLTMHPSRKKCRCKLGCLAEGLRDTAVVLAGNFWIEIRVAETGKEKLVERGRTKSLGVTPAQRQTLLFERDRHRPCGAYFLAEVGVAVDAESCGGEQVAVEEPCLLLEVTGVLLAARVEHG